MPTIEIEVKTEGARGCGYRKKGGLYLVSGSEMAGCGRLPIPLTVCPCCNAGIKPSRGWTWIQPAPLFKAKPCEYSSAAGPEVDLGSASKAQDRLVILHGTCPLADHNLPERAGLLWIGEKFYPTPAAYMKEARSQGFSRRISTVPKDFEVGKDFVLLAHRKCISTPRAEPMDGEELFDHHPGIFTMFRPERIEYIVRGDETDEELERIVKRGLTPIKVINPGRAEGDGDEDGDDDEG